MSKSRGKGEQENIDQAGSANKINQAKRRHKQGMNQYKSGINNVSSKSKSPRALKILQNVVKLLKEAKIDQLPPAEKQQLAQAKCMECMEFWDLDLAFFVMKTYEN